MQRCMFYSTLECSEARHIIQKSSRPKMTYGPISWCRGMLQGREPAIYTTKEKSRMAPGEMVTFSTFPRLLVTNSRSSNKLPIFISHRALRYRYRRKPGLGVRGLEQQPDQGLRRGRISLSPSMSFPLWQTPCHAQRTSPISSHFPNTANALFDSVNTQNPS